MPTPPHFNAQHLNTKTLFVGGGEEARCSGDIELGLSGNDLFEL